MASQRLQERRYLDRRQLEDLYGAAPEAAVRIGAFAAKHDLKIVEIPECRLAVLEGTADRLAAAFSSSSETGRLGTESAWPQQALGLPAELQNVVEGVFGLDDLRLHLPFPFLTGSPPPGCGSAEPHGAPQKSGPFPAARPEEVMRRYRFPEKVTGKGETVAMLLLGGGYYEDDLRAFFGERMPRIEVVEVGGAKNDPAPKEAVRDFFERVGRNETPTASPELRGQILWTLEATVDVELAGAFAPEADLVVYFAPNDTLGKLRGVAAVLADPERDISVLSNSWGLSEAHADSAYVTALDQLFMVAALRGISVCCSSGNYGPNVQGGIPTANFPASSPHVLACGGTTLWPAHLQQTESAWHEPLGNAVLATGGGFSRFFRRPVWQRGVGKAPAGEGWRGVPDVAGKADFCNGYEIFMAGRSWALGGGTSSAAPMWASLLARFNQALSTRVGWLTPLLYDPELARRLNDIVHGDNGLFQAVPGWDAATGWGSPDGEALLEALRSS